MLKIRVIGTKNEIAWFQNLVRNHLQIEVLDMSKLYISKEASDNYRSYKIQRIFILLIFSICE